MPGSSAERASRTAIWVVCVCALIVVDVLPLDGRAVRWTGWAAPTVAVLLGYVWVSGARLRTAAARLGTLLGWPYLSWLVLLGVPTVLWEWRVAPSLGRDRLISLGLGGASLQEPLSGHWLVGGVLLAAVVVRLLERYVPVHPAWLLPAALALTTGAQRWWSVPFGIGQAALLVSFVLVGRLLRAARPRVGWRIGLLLLVVGLLGVGLGPPVDVRHGEMGVPVLSALAVAAVACGLILLAERLAAPLPERPRRFIAAGEPVGLATVLVHGVGSYLAPDEWADLAVIAADVAIVAAVSGLLLALPHAAVLTGHPGWRARRR